MSFDGDCRLSGLSTASDHDLVLEANSGVQQAFVELCRRYSPLAKKRIQRILRNQEDVEDVLQETLFRAFTHLKGFGGRCKFSTWLTAIAVNSALMLLRRRRIRREVFNVDANDGGGYESIELVDPSPSPEQQVAKRQASLLIGREVRKLRPSIRNLVDTYYGGGHSLDETAKALGITVGAAKTRLLRARLKLRCSMEQYGVFSLDR